MKLGQAVSLFDLGDMWRYGCPKSAELDREGGSWSESEGLSSFDLREHNVESPALNVIRQNWSGEKVSLKPRIGNLQGCL